MKKIILLISSTFITLTFLVPFAFGMDNVDRVDHQNVKTIINEHLMKYPDLLNSSEGKDIVVFLGNTGAGKSTLINYLSGKQLEVDRFKNIILKDPTDPSAMAIGVGQDSQTSLPGLVQLDDLLFYDMPGFNETRGTAYSLVNACFIKNIIEKAKSVKLVFVAGIGEITGVKALSFKALLSQVGKLIPTEKVEDFSSLIITRSNQDREALGEYLLDKTTDPTLKLKSWVDSQRIDQMSEPHKREIDQDERATILEVIKKTESKKIKNLNIGVMYDTKDQHTIKGIYNVEIQNNINALINSNFCFNDFPSLEVGTLERKKKYLPSIFQDVSLSLEKSSLTQLLRPISTDLYELSLCNMAPNLFSRLIAISVEIDDAIREQERQGEARRSEETAKIKELYEKIMEAKGDAVNISCQEKDIEEHLKTRGNLVHELVCQISVGVESIKQNRQQLAEATTGKQKHPMPTGPTTWSTHPRTGGKINPVVQPPSQEQMQQYELTLQIFDAQIKQMQEDIEAATAMILKNMSAYEQYTGSQHPLWKDFITK